MKNGLVIGCLLVVMGVNAQEHPLTPSPKGKPTVTIIANLADSLQPKVVLLNARKAPTVVTLSLSKGKPPKVHTFIFLPMVLPTNLEVPKAKSLCTNLLKNYC